MSKRVSKILITCALIVILPLMIAVTTVAAIKSMSATVKIETYVNEVYADADVGYAKVKLDETSDVQHTISRGRDEQVTVEADYANKVYSFKGWYVGSKTQYEASIEKGENVELKDGNFLTFKMDAAENYVAVYDIIKYTVTYTYFEDPANQFVEVVEGGTAPTPKTEIVAYNYAESLKEAPEFEGDHKLYTFTGWKLDGNPVASAIFDTTEVVVNNPWHKNNKITVDLEIDGEKVNFSSLEETKTLYEGESLKVEELPLTSVFSEKLTAGYAYDWDFESLTVAHDTTDLTIKAKTTLVNYAFDFDGSKELFKNSAFTYNYNVEQENAVEAFVTALTNAGRYDFFAVNGIAYNGTTYMLTPDESEKGIADLLEVVKNASAHIDATAHCTIVGESNFGGMYLKGSLSYENTTPDSDKKVYVENTNGNPPIELNNKSNCDDAADFTQSLCHLLGIGNSNGEPWKVVAKDGTELKVTQVAIQVGGVTYDNVSVENVETMTVGEFIMAIKAEIGEDKLSAGLTNTENPNIKNAIEITSLTLYFA